MILKHLLFLSSLCSCIVLNSCDGFAWWGEGGSCDKNAFGLCKEYEPCTDCGIVLLAGYISEREAKGDPVTCSSVKPEWSSDVYAVIRDCNMDLITFCVTCKDNESINPSNLLEAGEYYF